MSKKEECLKALQCLYLEVDATIVDDVKLKVLAAINEYRQDTLDAVKKTLIEQIGRLSYFRDSTDKYCKKEEVQNTIDNLTLGNL